jgi:TRAP-type C4-dicarboxylate transport system substrate-binding protein
MRGLLTALGFVALALLATACAAPAGKSGSAKGVTLHLAVAGYPGSAEGRLAERFARQVESVSKGAITLSIDYRSTDTTSGAAVVASVRSGEAELAIAPVEAYQAAGAGELGALQAPFAITTLREADRVTNGPVAAKLVAGLAGLGLSGLGLVPEGLYRPFGFLKPLETPGDFEDVTIRAPGSALAAALLRSLGAHPIDASRLDVDTALRSGFASAPAPLTSAHDSFPAQMFVAGNVVFFPEVDVIAAGAPALDRLPHTEQAVIRRAAAAARAATIAGADEPGAARAFCRAGGTLVIAPAADVRALRRRASGILSALARSPATRGLVAELRRLAGPASEPSPCSPTSAAQSGGIGFEGLPRAKRERLLPPDGSYRRVLTGRSLLADGASEPDIRSNEGVVTLTLAGDRPFEDELFFELSWRGADSRPPCRGRAGVLNGKVAVRWNPATPCTSLIEFTWRLDGGDLVIESLAGTQPRWMRRAYLGRWKRVDCTSTNAPSQGGGEQARLC